MNSGILGIYKGDNLVGGWFYLYFVVDRFFRGFWYGSYIVCWEVLVFRLGLSYWLFILELDGEARELVYFVDRYVFGDKVGFVEEERGFGFLYYSGRLLVVSVLRLGWVWCVFFALIRV